MKPLRKIAQIALYFKLEKDQDFELYQNYDLSSYVIRIGRSDECEITIPGINDLFRAVSRKHCTMLYYPHEHNDFYVMDGVTDEATTENPNPLIIPSRTGIYVNNIRLANSEKWLLKNNDEVYLVPKRLKFVYLRPQNKVIDKLKDTFIPEEYL